MATKSKTSRLNGFQFSISEDSNYPDNLNIEFIKPDNSKLTKEEKKELSKLCKKMALDDEPVMDNMYSFDRFLEPMVRNEAANQGIIELVENNTYIPDLSDDDDGCAQCSCDCGKSSNPQDYYFMMGSDPNTKPNDFFIVVPKNYWDDNQINRCEEDFPVYEVLKNNKFNQVQENKFEYNGSLKDGRDTLIALGFVENLDM